MKTAGAAATLSILLAASHALQAQEVGRPQNRPEGGAAPAPLPAPPAGPRWIAPVPTPQPADKPIAIVGANVITLGKPGTITGGTVIIKSGKIAAVGPGLKAPAGATVIDGKGKWVIPGIIDCHSHTAIEGGVNEGSDIVTAEVRIADVLDNNDVNIYRQLAGGVTSVNVLHGSANVIGGQNAVIKMRWGKAPADLIFRQAPRGIKFALGENPKRSGATGGGRYPATRMGVEATLRSSFEEARTYRQEWQEYERKLKAVRTSSNDRPTPPRRDLRLETLRDIMDGKIFVHAHSYRADEILMLMRVAEDFGFRIRTFQHVLEGYKVATEMAKHGAGGSTFSDWWAYKMEALDAIPTTPPSWPARGGGVAQLRLGRAGAPAVLGGGQGHALRRGQRDGGPEDDHTEPGPAAGGGPLGGQHRAGQGRRPGGVRQPPVFARRAGGADAGRRHDLLRPGAGPGRPQATSAAAGIPAGQRGDRNRRAAGGGWAVRALALGLLLVAAPALGQTRQPPIVAITGGRVVPGDGQEMPSGTVIITGGKISAVGKDLKVPAGARVVDARGAVVYPGLIDGLTTLGLAEVSGVAATVDVAEVGDINPHAKAWTALNAHSDLIPVDLVAGVTNALTAPRGGLISGQSAIIRLTGSTPAALTVRAPVALHLNYPSGRAGRDERAAPEGEDRGRGGEERTFAERQREKLRNQERELRRLANCSRRRGRTRRRWRRPRRARSPRRARTCPWSR
jgi:imidazolonepropionase-like amidohydrolase